MIVLLTMNYTFPELFGNLGIVIWQLYGSYAGS
jgi:hypothetical protein